MTRSRSSLALAACVLIAGCGTHRITYVRSSIEAKTVQTQQRSHAHGLGPLIVGGGGLFGIINEMSPALVDWTGPTNVAEICPDGFSKVSHHHNFGQSVLAGFISWIIVVNAYHQSEVEFTCLHE